MTHTQRRHGGFTLIELMITVAVIGILAAIALPNYTSYILRGHRADARAALLQAATYMARVQTANGGYFVAGGNACPDVGNYSNKAYTVSFQSCTASTYTLQALAQVPQNQDGCGDFTLQQDGTEGVSGTVAVETCWGH